MNLTTTIWIYAGGEGSGCHGPNCGRPKVTLEPVENADFNLGGKDYSAFHIRDDEGNVVGSVVARQRGDVVDVRWVSGTWNAAKKDWNPIGIGVAKAVVRALKEKYPGTENVGGTRITGIHPKTHTEQTRVAWAEAM